MENDYGVIILAGGKSSRAEMPKGLRSFNNSIWILELIRIYQSYGVDQIIVGLGYHVDDYLEHLSNLKINLVLNENPERGSFSTLQECVKASTTKRTFIHPIDCAYPNQETIDKIKASISIITKPTYQGKSGHPILISNQIINQIESADSTSRLDLELRKTDKSNINWIDVNDQNILANLNTLEDWQAYLS